MWEQYSTQQDSSFFFLILFLKKFLVDIQIITRILLYWLSFFTGLFEARNERWISWLCFSLGSQFLHLFVIWVLRFCSDHQPSLISCTNEYGQPKRDMRRVPTSGVIVFTVWTHDLQVAKTKLYHCTKAHPACMWILTRKEMTLYSAWATTLQLNLFKVVFAH